LLGEVGCGKTTFLNHLLTSAGNTLLEPSKVCPVKIDIFTSAPDTPIKEINFIDFLYNRILQILQCPEDYLKLGRSKGRFLRIIAGGSQLSDKSTIVYNFVSEYRKKTGRYFLFVFDNLDFLLHRNDMETFFPDGIDKYKEALLHIKHFVGDFLPGRSPLGQLGANIIFVLRTDSFNTLPVSTEELPDPDYLMVQRIWSLEMPDWQEVLNARISLLEWALNQISDAGVKKALEERTKVLRLEACEKNSKWEQLRNHIKKLAGYGLRDFMIFLRNYCWLEGRVIKNASEEHPLNRVMDHYPVGLIAFMLQGKRLYSQLYTRTPNIYVTNNRSDHLQNKLVSHSYWLKRLLLTYINQFEHYAIYPNDLVRVFNDDGKGYDEDLIRACLGSMAMANASCLIRVNRDAVRDNRIVMMTTLKITDRGRHFLQTIFDRFFYLQIITDDFWLRLPVCLDKLFFINNNSRDYSYLVAPYDEYIKGAKELIEQKVLQSRVLLILLDEAFKIESKIYQSVFENLSRLGLEFPNPSNMLRTYDEEIQTLMRYFPEVIKLTILKTKSEEYRTSIHEDLKAVYLGADLT
jgi:hypothetical protein